MLLALHNVPFYSGMVRNFIRKTNRGENAHDLVQHGVNEIICLGRSIRSLALEIGMNPMTLCRYVMQAQVMGSRNLQTGYRSPQRVFSTDQENVLQDYIIRSANIYFGLSPKDVRVLVYECALEFGVTIPNLLILLVLRRQKSLNQKLHLLMMALKLNNRPPDDIMDTLSKDN